MQGAGALGLVVSPVGTVAVAFACLAVVMIEQRRCAYALNALPRPEKMWP